MIKRFLLFLCWIIDKISNRLLFSPTKLKSGEKYIGGISYIYDQPESSPIILYSHGSGGNLTSRIKIRQFCQKHNIGLLLYDYYGYGASEDRELNEKALRDSISQLIPLISGKSVILMGASLGCYPTSWLASQNLLEVKAVILAVPFDKLSSVCWLLRGYNNVEFVEQIQVPILIIRATKDKLMNYHCAQNLQDKAPNAEIYDVNTGHSNYFTEEIQDRLKIWIAKIK